MCWAIWIGPETGLRNGSLPQEQVSWSAVDFIKTNDECREDETAPGGCSGHWPLQQLIWNPKPRIGALYLFFLFCGLIM